MSMNAQVWEILKWVGIGIAVWLAVVIVVGLLVAIVQEIRRSRLNRAFIKYLEHERHHDY